MEEKTIRRVIGITTTGENVILSETGMTGADVHKFMAFAIESFETGGSFSLGSVAVCANAFAAFVVEPGIAEEGE